MRPKDPPINMLIAMIVMSVLCIVPAVPSLTQITLYRMLPTAVDYIAYTPGHIITNLQLLLFSGLAFFLLLPLLKRTNTIILDFDWFYRGFARYIVLVCFMIPQVPLQYIRILLKRLSRNVQSKIHSTYGPGSIMARRWKIGTNATWTIFLLGIYLVVYYAYSLNHK
jgi:multicomponent Na+:H+ antiporter subunit D